MSEQTDGDAIARLARVIADQRPDIERLQYLVDKYKWQVIDTCKRAEAAEALLAEATDILSIMNPAMGYAGRVREFLAKLKIRAEQAAPMHLPTTFDSGGPE